MNSILRNNGYICRNCISRLSRQYSTALTPGAKPSPAAAFRASGSSGKATRYQNERLKNLREIHTTGTNRNAETEIVEIRPRGRIRPGRPRRVERVVKTSHVLSESPEFLETNTQKPLRRSRREAPLEELQPSAPSAPLGSRPKPNAAPIPAPEPPKVQNKKHAGAPEDFNWYWESFPPTINDKVLANRFFTNHGKDAKLLRSVAQFRMFPESDVPEVAFVGRSNVGKSSLLNAVVGADIKSLLARTSATPGFTKTMNLYGVGSGNGIVIKKQPDGRDKIMGRSGLVIVDMPGYGEGSLSSWGIEIMKYIQSRKQLRRVFVLLDAQHGIKDKDRSLLASLRLAGVSHQIILSKLDKLYIPKAKEIKHFNGKSMDKLKPKGTIQSLREAMEKLKVEIKPPVGGGALGEILGCSAETVVDGKRLGIDHVRYAVLKAAGMETGGKKLSK
ncbi:hypothetical protein T440DRAFT_419115 [Plenodomus tracheiphilus IPT5]|uniref:EngB-type G domain-containing protein n=1 Tax=Plenodomus tracheiphilus IPT5 TaxID=1408161 RepID=A0A6A7BF49_9PLEO|nr:hypothetical protein T440DRAFT_419115 [Plenodomus tracheiphilus IPT5]